MDKTERCDAKDCGAQAYVWATIKSHSVAYCGHHANAYWPGLIRVSDQIVDMRHMISSA